MRVTSKHLRLLIDTNVWLDYFMRSGGAQGTCERLFEAAVEAEADLLVSPTTLKDVFYLIQRRFKRQDTLEGKTGTSYEPAAWACIEFMLEIATPSPLSLVECSMARTLHGKFGDYEDNLILATGESAQADYIVTSDNPLLARFPEACITPVRAIELLE